MKVELSIKDDKEMRDMIKDMIRGQVKNVIREDMSDIIAGVLEKELGSKKIRNVDLAKAAYKVVYDRLSPAEVRDMAMTHVRSYGDDYLSLAVSKVAKELITINIKDQIAESVTEKMKGITLGLSVQE